MNTTDIKKTLAAELKRLKPISDLFESITEIEALIQQHGEILAKVEKAKAELEKTGKASDKAKQIIADATDKADALLKSAEESASASISAAKAEASKIVEKALAELAVAEQNIAAKNAEVAALDAAISESKSELAAIEKATNAARAKLKGFIE